MRVLRAAEEPVAEIEPVLYEKNHPGPRLRAQITVLQDHPADFDQSFTPSLRSMTRGEDRHPISVVIAGVCPRFAVIREGPLGILNDQDSLLATTAGCQWRAATGSPSNRPPSVHGRSKSRAQGSISYTSLFFRALYFIVPRRDCKPHGEPPIECRPRHAFAAGDSRKPVTGLNL